MSFNVLGLDISRNFAVGFVLSGVPASPFDWFNNFGKTKIKYKKKDYWYNTQSIFFPNNSKGLNIFKSLSPNVLILEPTGYWYAQYWVAIANQIGCQVLWMAHQSLAKHRAHYGFKNKNDDIDAFVLALTYFDKMLPLKKRYIQHYNNSLIDELRLTVYERKRLLKARNQNTNQLGQYLEVEWPEIATRSLIKLNKQGVNPTLAHLGGLSFNRQIPRVNTGIGVSDRTFELVKATLDLQQLILLQENSLKTLLCDRSFEPYVIVLKEYGFGVPLQAHLLLKIYPLERFLDGGKVARDHNNQNLSLRQFQAYLGLGYYYSASGDSSQQQSKVKKSWLGSKIIRSDLYAWLLANPCKITRYQPQNATQLELKELWANPRLHEGKLLPSFESLGKDGICRMLFVVTRWLWSDLLTSLNSLEF